MNCVTSSSMSLALSNSESVNIMLVSHCLTYCPMSSCFVATSSSCCIFSRMTLDQYWCAQKNPIKCFAMTSLAGFNRQCFETLSAVHLWITPILHLALSVALAFLEQCKLFSAFSISLWLVFCCVEFCIRLLSVALYRHLHLKHNYIVRSH